MGGTIGISQAGSCHDLDALRSLSSSRDHGERDGQAGDQTGQRPDRPEDEVDRDGRGEADDVLADQQRSGPDGQHGHRGRTVELAHHRVSGIGPRVAPVPRPVHGERYGQPDQGHCRQEPDADRKDAQADHVYRQARGRVGHDSGAHHRGEPVRGDVLEHLARALQFPQERAPFRLRSRWNVGSGRGCDAHPDDDAVRRGAAVESSCLSRYKRCLWSDGGVLSRRVPDLIGMQLLLAVQDTGSMAAAGAALGITQQAASLRVRAMEAQIGLPLVMRSSHGSSLTAAGALVAGWAAPVIQAADRLDAGIGSLQTTRNAHLRVAASLTIAEHLAPRWFLALRAGQQRSGEDLTELELITANSDAVVRAVLDGSADLGFIEAPGAPPAVRSKVVGHDHLVIVAAPGHPWTRAGRTVVAGRTRPHAPGQPRAGFRYPGGVREGTPGVGAARCRPVVSRHRTGNDGRGPGRDRGRGGARGAQRAGRRRRSRPGPAGAGAGRRARTAPEIAGRVAVQSAAAGRPGARSGRRGRVVAAVPESPTTTRGAASGMLCSRDRSPRLHRRPAQGRTPRPPRRFGVPGRGRRARGSS